MVSAQQEAGGLEKNTVEPLQNEGYKRIPNWPFVKCAKSASLVRSLEMGGDLGTFN